MREFEQQRELRIDRPAEQIEMHAHKGECKYCGGLVKMSRHLKTLELEPDNCWCLRCGQHYFVVTDDIRDWEHKQWREKNEEVS